MNKFRNRKNFLLGLFVFMAIVFVVQLYLLQIKRGAEFKDMADRQYASPKGGLFNRGTIYFTQRDGELVSAATTKSGFKLAINPSKLNQNPEEVFEKINKIIEIDKEKFLKSAGKKTDPYEELAQRLNDDQAKKIKELEIAGVDVFRENWRNYPTKNLASQVIGFTAYDKDNYLGRYGLEKFYENILARDAESEYVNFFADIFAEINSFLSGQNKKGDIVTTIEPSVQMALEQEIAKIQDTWNSEKTGAIIINPNTGEIVAMGNGPTFDLNDFQNVDSVSVYRNFLVEDVREMGSIIKPIIVSAGLDKGVITSETSYTDNGFVNVGNRTIYNFDKKGRGPNTTVQGILNESLNTGMVFISQKLGKESMKKYLLDFGIGEQTGIDLPNEGKNLIKNLDGNRDVEYANISFGQGIALTPISTVRALSAMANGGFLITPHIVKEIKYDNGQKEEQIRDRTGPIIKAETSDEISRILTEVVDTTLRGGKEKLEHYSIAAKTGTAQIPNPAGGGYYEDRNLHSFFGYFPAYDPQFLIFFYTVYPKEVKYSSQTLTDPFFNMAKFLIHYYNVQPDR